MTPERTGRGWLWAVADTLTVALTSTRGEVSPARTVPCAGLTGLASGAARRAGVGGERPKDNPPAAYN